ncbi:hypothetical protein LCGC14_1137460 [marine sediment metagenome]|uniref:Uncharacterized protein n=1 Tax=marine sediment metagenome TaxID=412755 RepID=A0A0F9M459_9ZZZZ
MANTVIISNHFITIKTLDADWNLPTSSNAKQFKDHGLMVRSIRYTPGASAGGDVMKIFEGSTGGAEIFSMRLSTGINNIVTFVQYYGHAGKGVQMFPYISSSGLTISSGSTLTFELA